jgi:hypothetical protein
VETVLRLYTRLLEIGSSKKRHGEDESRAAIISPPDALAVERVGE